MLFASGVNFGLRRTWPHAVGIAVGFGVLLAAVGLGVGVLIEQSPVFATTLKVAGGLYMLYLAYRIATADQIEKASAGARPMTLMEAALFQWVNPKAWVMAITAMSAYTGEGNYWFNVLIIVVVFVCVNFPSVTCWAGFGHLMSHWFSNPRYLRIFNITMALALVLSLWPLLTV